MVARQSIEPRAAVPGDRPRGLPKRALAAGFASFFLAAFTPPLIVELFGAWHGEGLDLLISNIPWLVIAEAIVFLPIWNGLGQGRLWAVRAFRIAGWCLVALCLVLLIGATMMWTGSIVGRAEHWRIQTGFVFYATLPLVVCAILMAHGLLRVAWLDPAALPDTWEPPIGAMPPPNPRAATPDQPRTRH